MRTRKHLIISTGALNNQELYDLQINLNLHEIDYSFLHCIVDYPAPDPQTSNYYKFRSLVIARINCGVGVSDHTTEISHLIENRLYYDIIEKHVNVLNIKDRPDTPHSISLEDLKELTGKYLPKTDYEPYISDIAKENNRLILTSKPVKKGDYFSKENTTVLRHREYRPDCFQPTLSDQGILFRLRADRDYMGGEPCPRKQLIIYNRKGGNLDS